VQRVNRGDHRAVGFVPASFGRGEGARGAGVGYALTPRGHDLLACLAPLDGWAQAWAKEAGQPPEMR
jgi:hypothetical protein